MRSWPCICLIASDRRRRWRAEGGRRHTRFREGTSLQSSMLTLLLASKREISMKKVYGAAACVGEFLTIGSLVNAQISSGRYVNECWDQANKVVRNRSGTNATGSSGNNTVGSAGTSSAASRSPSSSASGIPSDRNENANAPPTRPAGLPNC
jgi:hypothetical protein